MSDSRPADWCAESLRNLASKITSGGTPTAGSARYYASTGIPFVKIDDMTRSPDREITETELHITDAAIKESAAKIFPPGTILVSMYGTIGLTKVLKNPMATNQAIAALIPEFKCHPSLLAHVLEYSRPRLERAASQTTQPNISAKVIGDFEVRIPQCEREQRRIAEVLETTDEAIRSMERLIANLEQAKVGLLHDLLTCGVDEHDLIRDPVAQPSAFKRSPLGLVPKQWAHGHISEWFDVRGGKRLPAGHGYSASPSNYRYLRVTDFAGKNAVDSANLKSLAIETFKALARYEIRNDDLFISIAGSIGHVGVYKSSEGLVQTILTENAARLVARRYENPEFFAMQLNGPSVQRQISVEIGTGGGVPKLALFRIASLYVVRPQEAEQARIVEVMRAADERITAETNRLSKLRLVKQGLMDDLLTGRVRVSGGEGALA
jgi:type I restriction enzyme S subunit